MLRTLLITIFSASYLLTLAQPAFVLRYDLQQDQVDTLAYPAYDSTQLRAQTPASMGSLPGLATLPTQVPPGLQFNQTTFSRKIRVEDSLSVTDYPIRCAVKIFGVEADTLVHLCSGMMVSRSLVLTSSHCFRTGDEDTLAYDSLLLIPAYDQGSAAPAIGEARAKTVWMSSAFPRDIYRDWALIEIDQPLGDLTGWIGVGLEADDNFFLSPTFYKFGYPNATSFFPTNSYNGDTLYLSWGKIDLVHPEYFGVNGHRDGLPGESGSVLATPTADGWALYGTFIFLSDFRHARILPEGFWFIESQVAADILTPIESPTPSAVRLWVSANGGWLSFSKLPPSSFQLALYSLQGKRLVSWREPNPQNLLPLPASLPAGIYLLRGRIDDQPYAQKVFLSGRR